MGKKYKLAFFFLIPVAVVAIVLFLARGHDLAVLDPKGLIGLKERDLMITATLLMLLVVIPVFVLMFYISWKYREGNTKARYSPDWDGNRMLELGWWGLAGAIIFVLAIITFRSSHELDPFKPIAGPKPLNVQVVALQWKWLFIYPDQHVASLNYLQLPVSRPISFQITSDAPMNAFWIPRLGGQVYAMSGMDMRLHLISDQPGTYEGLSANISGRGFSGMHFPVKVGSDQEFNNWTKSLTASQPLTMAEYDKLSSPSENNPASYYSAPAKNLYDRIILKYMVPESQIGENSTLASVHGGHY